jgi:exonuclease VII large subunit
VQDIGVITSKSGVVIQDFLKNLGRFGFKVYFYDARVEGIEATPTLVEAIRWFNKKYA